MRLAMPIIMTAAVFAGGCGAPEPPQPTAQRYLALGDSLSMGIGANDGASAFPALVTKRWRAMDCPIDMMNAGLGGSTSGQVASDQVPLIKAFKPTVITLQVGTNDIVNGVGIDAYRQNVGSVLDAATSSGARVIVLSMYEWPRAPWFVSPEGEIPGVDMAAQRVAFDDVMITEAQLRGAEFVDLRADFAVEADRGEWYVDGIHPNQRAYDDWAAALVGAVPTPCNSD